MEMKIDKPTVAILIAIAGTVGTLSATVFAKSDRVAQLETRVENVEEKVKKAKIDNVRELGKKNKKSKTKEGKKKKKKKKND
ncbi:hypothetical protein [uncultured Limnobacter sp.]|uniref:hypothetical protein n=1 Tax=uncultured Limnobacter sp. TaxID=199681 RepID=UPI0030F9ECD9